MNVGLHKEEYERTNVESNRHRSASGGNQTAQQFGVRLTALLARRFTQAPSRRVEIGQTGFLGRLVDDLPRQLQKKRLRRLPFHGMHEFLLA